jgi:hypothetical protein
MVSFTGTMIFMAADTKPFSRMSKGTAACGLLLLLVLSLLAACGRPYE